jgi:MMPL family
MRGHRRGHSAIRQRGGRCRRHDGVPYDLTAGAGDRGARRGSPFRCDPLLEGTDTDVLVGGQTAGVVDFSEANGERLPILIAVVIGLSFILLAVVFRSILVPIKAAIMNVLPIGAAYGVLVAMFQWGWSKDLVGVDTTAPIEAWRR